MENCLKCNKTLVNKIEFNSSPHPDKTITHVEHILQNAIAGKLKSAKILCEKCGSIFNDEIDSAFIKIFRPFH